jgi:hypothetical protein
VDFVDRDPLLLAICRGVNDRAGVSGSCRQLDLGEPAWCQHLPEGRFDVMRWPAPCTG